MSGETQNSEMGLVVVGAGGRMGQTLIRTIQTIEGAKLVGAIERSSSPLLGRDAGEVTGIGPLGVRITDDPLPVFAGAHGVLDFTSPAASVEFAGLAAQARIVHVIGTTGCSAEDEDKIRAAARHATIVKSGNMSLGVNLLSVLVQKAAQALDPADFDIEILEMHHKHKVDAPSGTALLLGEAAAKGRDIALAENSVRVRDGYTGPRETGSIGFATLRGGSVIGEHSVILAGPGERIVLSHHAEDRSIFARGAITGWRDPGLTEQGHAEAKAAGQRLKAAGLKFDIAYTSALSRAQVTCQHILDELGQSNLETIRDQALNERDYGDLSGLNKDDARAKWGEEQVHIWRRSYDVPPPGGESLKDTGARVWPYYLHTVQPHVLRGETVLVAAHGNSLRALIMALDGLTPEQILKQELNTGVPVIYRLNADSTVASKEILEA